MTRIAFNFRWIPGPCQAHATRKLREVRSVSVMTRGRPPAGTRRVRSACSMPKSRYDGSTCALRIGLHVIRCSSSADRDRPGAPPRAPSARPSAFPTAPRTPPRSIRPAALAADPAPEPTDLDPHGHGSSRRAISSRRRLAVQPDSIAAGSCGTSSSLNHLDLPRTVIEQYTARLARATRATFGKATWCSFLRRARAPRTSVWPSATASSFMRPARQARSASSASTSPTGTTGSSEYRDCF